MEQIIEASFRHRFFEAMDAEMHIAGMVCLEKLDLSHNEIERPPRLPSTLISLNLSYNPKCTQMSGLAVSSLMNLRELNLTNNALTTTNGLAHLTNLEILNLADNQIKKLTGLEMLGGLRILILVDNDISNVIALRCLSCNYSLESLDLRGNPVCTSNKYATVRNMLGEALREMDGALIKAKRFSASRVTQGSAPEDQSYMFYAAGGAGRGGGGEESVVDRSFCQTRAKYTSIEDRATPEKQHGLRRASMARGGSSGSGKGSGRGKGRGKGSPPGGYAGFVAGVNLQHASPPPVPGGGGGVMSSVGSVGSSQHQHQHQQLGNNTSRGPPPPPGGGYTAQHLSHTHATLMSGNRNNGTNSSGSQVSVAGGYALKPSYSSSSHSHSHSHNNQSQATIAVPMGEGTVTVLMTAAEEEEGGGHTDAHAVPVCYNGDGSGKPSSRRRSSSSTAHHHSLHSPAVMNANHTSYYQDSSAVGAMLREFHVTRKSPLPWRNAPDVRPRPWKGALVYDTPYGERDREWVARVDPEGQGVHMDNQAPWVSPVTVAAYARDRRNVSNKSDYKISKEGHPVPRTRPTPTGAGGSGANGSGSYSKTKQQKKKQQQQAMPGSPGGGGGSSSRNNSTNNGGAVEYYSAAAIMPAWAQYLPEGHQYTASSSSSSSAFDMPFSDGSDVPPGGLGSPSSLDYSMSRDEGYAASPARSSHRLHTNTGSRDNPSTTTTSATAASTGQQQQRKKTAGYEQATFSAYLKTSPVRDRVTHGRPSIHPSSSPGSPRGGVHNARQQQQHNGCASDLSPLERLALGLDDSGMASISSPSHQHQHQHQYQHALSSPGPESPGSPRRGLYANTGSSNSNSSSPSGNYFQHEVAPASPGGGDRDGANNTSVSFISASEGPADTDVDADKDAFLRGNAHPHHDDGDDEDTTLLSVSAGDLYVANAYTLRAVGRHGQVDEVAELQAKLDAML